MKAFLRGVAIGLVIAGAVWLAMYWQPVMVHLSQWTGTSESASRSYNYWSGFGSVWPWNLAILGGIIALVRHHTCAHRPCWRIGRHVTADGHKLCHRHLAMPISALELPEVHEDHR